MPAGGADVEIAVVAGDAAGVARTMGGEACGSSSWSGKLVIYNRCIYSILEDVSLDCGLDL